MSAGIFHMLSDSTSDRLGILSRTFSGAEELYTFHRSSKLLPALNMELAQALSDGLYMSGERGSLLPANMELPAENMELECSLNSLEPGGV